jgi:hypothetical protein
MVNIQYTGRQRRSAIQNTQRHQNQHPVGCGSGARTLKDTRTSILLGVDQAPEHSKTPERASCWVCGSGARTLKDTRMSILLGVDKEEHC